MKKQLRRLLIYSTTILILSSCAHTQKPVPVQFYKLKVHYMHQDEQAPFDGYLINEYTWKQITKKLAECKKIKKSCAQTHKSQ